MSARQGPVRATREMTITHADLKRLFSTAAPGDRNAILLLETIKMLARGRRVVHVYNGTLVKELGWSERTIQRAKQRARQAGVPMYDQVDRRGSKATAFVLDRSWIPALGRPTTVAPGGDTGGAPSKEEKTLHLVDPASPWVSEVEAPPPRGSPALPAAADEPSSESDLAADAAPVGAAPLEHVPEAEQALAELRRRWGELPATPAAADRPAVARRLARQLTIAGGCSWTAVQVALVVFVQELCGPIPESSAAASIDEEVA